MTFASAATEPQIAKPLSTGACFVYALPAGAAFFLLSPIVTILPGIYAKYFGLSLPTISAALVIARVADGVVDPAIGYLSDRSRQAGLPRKVWAVLGILVLISAAYFVFSPPADVTMGYLLFWTMLCYLGWTLFDIPHAAWGAELTRGDGPRTKLYAIRSAATGLGSIGFFALPLLPIFSTTEYTPQTLRIGVAIGLALLVLTVIPMLFVPEGECLPRQRRDSLRRFLAAIFENRPLLLFLGAYLFAGLAIGMWSGLLFIYVDSYLHLSAKLAFVFLCATIIALAAIPMWLHLVKVTSKKIAWASGVASSLLLLVLFLLIPPGAGGFGFLLLCGVGMAVASASQGVVGPSVLADIVDYGSWKFGDDRAATYFSFFAMVTKANAGIGAAAGLAVAGLFGFDPSNKLHDTQALWALRAGFGLIPALLLGLALMFILAMPINQRRQGIITRALARRRRHIEMAPTPIAPLEFETSTL